MASSARACTRSSRKPRDRSGTADSDDFGSGKTFGPFGPLSTAGMPISVSQIGFAPGLHAVAVVSTPSTRSICALAHQPAMSFWRNVHGLP
jgi:hypothetical protein